MVTEEERNNALAHFGVAGMRWGVRNNRSSSKGRKTAFGPTSKDGRSVNKLFGKRNRTKVRNFFLGNPNEFIKKMPAMNKKYSSLNKQDKEVMRKKVSGVLATVSVASMAAMVYMLKN